MLPQHLLMASGYCEHYKGQVTTARGEGAVPLLICTLSISKIQILLILGAKISIFRNHRLRAAVPMLLLHE